MKEAKNQKNTKIEEKCYEDIFIITDFPEITKLEVKELIKKESIYYQNVCEVKKVTNEEIAKLCYHLQSAIKICIKISDFKIKNNSKPDEILKEIKNNFEKVKINNKYLNEINTFEARTENNLDIHISTNEVNKLLGEIILNNNNNLSVNLKHPDISFYGYTDYNKINDEVNFFIGIDLIGFDLTKRPYKIWSKADSLNGAFAYSLLRIADIKNNSTIIDPFAGTGIIAIEAGLFQSKMSSFRFENKFSAFNLEFIKKDFLLEEAKERKNISQKKLNIYAYDHLLKNVLGIQKNAKLAGIEKLINMSKISVDWLDTKIDEKSVDFIITDPPKLNKRIDNSKEIEKIYDELFYQSKFILKKSGKIFILTNDITIPITQAKRNKFELKQNIELKRGEQIYYYLEFQ